MGETIGEFEMNFSFDNTNDTGKGQDQYMENSLGCIPDINN